MADNKLWEGHRLIYPELREKVQKQNVQKISPPNHSEDELNKMEEKIKYAIAFNNPLLIQYVDNNILEDIIAFKVRVTSRGIKCAFENGRAKEIPLTQVVKLSLV
jgi:hypothetical protein